MTTGAIFTLFSTDNTSKQTLCILVLTTLKGTESHERKQRIFIVHLFLFSFYLETKDIYE